jgi:hypothetical protein
MQAIVTEIVLTFLPTSFLLHPAIGLSVTMPAILLGVQIMTHVGTTLLLPLPGSGVYDPTMPECLISVAQLLEAGYHIIFATATRLRNRWF